MRTSQKVALTILISLLITGGFAALAYTGLFRVLETDFFSERVRIDQEIRLINISDTVSSWNEDNISRFDALSRDRNFQSVYSLTQREEEIAYRAQVSDSFEDLLMGYNGIRIVDNDGRVQFSTFAGDIGSEQIGEDGRRLYENWNRIPDTFELSFASDKSDIITIHDGVRQRVVYLLPIQNSGFITRGWMIVYMTPDGLADRLAGEGLIDPGGRVQIIDRRGVIVDIRPAQIDAVNESIDKLWPIDGDPAEFALLAEGVGDKYWLAGMVAEDGTWVGKLIPGRLLGFTVPIQILILATVFISIALLLFLLLNLRQDRTEVLRGRIKKLQVSLLRDWLEHHEDRKLRLSDLESRRDEVRSELRSGLGKLRGHKEKEADQIIDEGWTRIIEILAEKEIERGDGSTVATEASADSQPPIDMKQLEDMITRAVADAKFIVPQEALAGLQIQVPIPNAVPTPGRKLNVEYLGDDDIDELGEVEELTEEDEDAELAELGEPVEVEELTEEDEVAELAELGEPVEVEELTEEDEDTELAELGEPVEVEELTEEDEVAELAELGEPVDSEASLEFEDLSTGDEFTELSDIPDNELPEIEELADVSGSIPTVEELIEPEITEDDTEGKLADTLEELELVEELEQIEKDEEDIEILEVLPVVLSDDSRELIEIDKVDQDRLYMFDNEFNNSEKIHEDYDESADLQEIDEQVDELEELEELEELPAESSREPVSEDDRGVLFFSIEDIQERIMTGDTISLQKDISGEESGESMESLIMTRTIGILPGIDSLEGDFRFEDETPELIWSANGLDYDRFLRGFKKGATGIYKSLMSLSKDYNAICGVLLAGSRKGLETDYAVGLDDDSAKNLSVTRNEPVWSEWFNERKVVYIPNLSGSLYAEKTSHNEFRLIRSALFIPAVFHGSQSYIFLGFKEPPTDPLSMLVSVKSIS